MTVSKSTLYCSFCGLSQHEVRKLIAGPTVFICDKCVDLCSEINHRETAIDGLIPLRSLRIPGGIESLEQIRFSSREELLALGGLLYDDDGSCNGAQFLTAALAGLDVLRTKLNMTLARAKLIADLEREIEATTEKWTNDFNSHIRQLRRRHAALKMGEPLDSISVEVTQFPDSEPGAENSAERHLAAITRGLEKS